MPKFTRADVDTEGLDLTEYDVDMVPEHGEPEETVSAPDGFEPDVDALEPGVDPDAADVDA